MTERFIRRFQTEGETLESHLMRNRKFVADALEGAMRDEGWIPVLDLDVGWNLEYLGGEKYKFVCTMHGVYLGPELSHDAQGLVGGKVMWKPTRTPKSRESSSNSESE